MVEHENDPVSYSEPAGGRKKLVLFGVMGGLILALLFACLVYLYALSPGPGHKDSEVRVFIPPRSGFRQIKDILVESGVIDDDIRFAFVVQFLGVAKKLKAGEYLFSSSSSPLQIIQDLAIGKNVLRSIVIPEGLNIFQMADLFAKEGWSDKESFLTLVRSQDFIRSLGLNIDSLEGYMFPDTYFFPKGEDIGPIVRKMVEKGRQVVEEVCQHDDAKHFRACLGDVVLENSGSEVDKPKNIGRSLTLHQIITLASIVEKEAALESERPLVSRVFLNRLTANMKLQADPTVIYGLQKFGMPLTKVDLKTPGRYNTYVNKGLPPGPICNPGRASIRAVFQPAEDSFYYFVSQNDGSHFFSRSLKEHNRAVKRYREAKQRGGSTITSQN